jgi:hypothetical protein
MIFKGIGGAGTSFVGFPVTEDISSVTVTVALTIPPTLAAPERPIATFPFERVTMGGRKGFEKVLKSTPELDLAGPCM